MTSNKDWPTHVKHNTGSSIRQFFYVDIITSWKPPWHKDQVKHIKTLANTSQGGYVVHYFPKVILPTLHKVDSKCITSPWPLNLHLAVYGCLCIAPQDYSTRTVPHGYNAITSAGSFKLHYTLWMGCALLPAILPPTLQREDALCIASPSTFTELVCCPLLLSLFLEWYNQWESRTILSDI